MHCVVFSTFTPLYDAITSYYNIVYLYALLQYVRRRGKMPQTERVRTVNTAPVAGEGTERRMGQQTRFFVFVYKCVRRLGKRMEVSIFML